MITWKKSGTNKVFEPKTGIDPEFDSANEVVDEVKKSLANYLKQVSKEIGFAASYSCSSTKFRYEIEVPDSMDLDGDDFILTSKVKGKKRYQTDALVEIIQQLLAAEADLLKAIMPFLRTMFGRFYSYRQVWQNVVSCISELDCLNSLAMVSGQTGMCKPSFCEGVLFEIKGMKHLSPIKGFVANDVKIDEQFCLLITGPNMGGKSTILR